MSSNRLRILSIGLLILCLACFGYAGYLVFWKHGAEPGGGLTILGVFFSALSKDARDRLRRRSVSQVEK